LVTANDHRKDAIDFGYAVALWTRAIVRDVLRREFGVQASAPSIFD